MFGCFCVPDRSLQESEESTVAASHNCLCGEHCVTDTFCRTGHKFFMHLALYPVVCSLFGAVNCGCYDRMSRLLVSLLMP